MYNILFFIVLFLAIINPLTAAELVDPTRPPWAIDATPTLAKDSLVLSAIFITPKQRLAVVNDQFLKIGDHYAGFEVINIEINKVQLKGPSGILELRLITQPVKQQSMPTE